MLLDADLQDPPELLGAMIDKWREGFHVVYAVRRKRRENMAKRACYFVFYRVLRALADIEIPLDSGDFCLMDRVVVDHLKSLPERNRSCAGCARGWASSSSRCPTTARRAPTASPSTPCASSSSWPWTA